MIAAGIEPLVQLYETKAVSVSEVVQDCLDHIAAYDRQGPCLNAVTRINQTALTQAKQLDQLARQGELAGPLHGIPVLLKDNVDEAGIPNTAGSICLSGNIPDDDATIIRRIKHAGAIVIARANLHEFAIWGETASSFLGQTLNPYDLTRTPGGSSGGTGAGVAAGYAMAGIGTDTVNSVRSPASANSLVGLRPTQGLVSRAGIIPYSLTQDTAGPITVSVADAAALLDVMAGEDAADAQTRSCRGKQPASYVSGLSPAVLSNARIGVLRSFFGSGPEHRPVNEIMEKALRTIQTAGAELIEVPDLIDADWITAKVSVHLFDLEPDLNSYLSRLKPEAAAHSLQDILASGRFHPGIGDNIRQALGLSRKSPEYAERLYKQAELRARLLTIMAGLKLTALVYPHQRRLVVKVGERQVERNGVLAAVTGFPSLVVPAGFSPPEAAAPLGVPAGIEFLGRPWTEAELLSVGYAFEQIFPARRPPLL